jgi:hypothetical protein
MIITPIRSIITLSVLHAPILKQTAMLFRNTYGKQAFVSGLFSVALHKLNHH